MSELVNSESDQWLFTNNVKLTTYNLYWLFSVSFVPLWPSVSKNLITPKRRILL